MSKNKLLGIMDYGVKKARAGLGLFAKITYNRYERIIQYVGEEVSFDATDPDAKHLMHLDDKTVIDGKCHTNKARYINHSCRPTAEAFIVGRKVFIYAKRRIQPGDEITIDYGRDYWDQHIRPKGCQCIPCVDALNTTS